MHPPIRIQLKEGDNVAACMMHAYGSWPYLFAWVIFGVVGYAVHLTDQAPEDVRFFGLLFAAVSGAIVVSRLVLTPLLLSWNARTAWSDYVKYRDGKNYILLYMNRMTFRVIPKRAFPDDASRADFEHTVREKIGAVA
jgi:YcxB-like protein